MRRLSIVIPYRDRASHLAALVPHLHAYFQRDKIDSQIPYRVLVVEQEGEAPFNRGALKNIGFLLAEKQSDYVCFHDVDYLPIWADYSSVAIPTPILWYGAELRPIAPGRSERMIREDMEAFFGGVLLVPNEQFRQVNGYANCYWGWGFEDTDLKYRFVEAGIKLQRRKGTFRPLRHDNEGFDLNGKRNAIANVNQRILERRWAPDISAEPDGLSTVQYQVMARRPIDDSLVVGNALGWEHVTVRILSEPHSDQLMAVSSSANLPRSERSHQKTRRR